MSGPHPASDQFLHLERLCLLHCSYVGGVNRGIGYVASLPPRVLPPSTRSRYRSHRGAGITEGIDNPTFVDVSPDGRSLAAVSEVDGWNEGLVSGYAIDPATGTLEYLSKQATRGDYTAHLGHDLFRPLRWHRHYGGLPVTAKPNKSIAIFSRAADGTLGTLVSEATHSGLGADPARQERPHAHCIRWTPDNKFVVVADLGIDRLVIYRFDPASGALTPHGETVLPPGSGPRHIQFHPTLPYAYLANELTCTLASLAFDATAGSFAILAENRRCRPRAAGSSCAAVAIAAGAGTSMWATG